MVLHNRRGNLPFHQRTIYHLAGRRMILRHGCATASARTGGKATNRNCALSNCVHLVIHTEKEGLQEHTPLERLGVAHRGDLHIQALTRLNKGRDLGRHHHHRHIFCRESGRLQIDAITLQEIGDRLLGIDRVLVSIAGQARHQAVPNQLVSPGSSHHRQIADTDSAR